MPGPQASDDDHELAHALATRAGEMLVDLRGALLESGTAPEEVGAHGDLRSHQFLSQALARTRPGDAVLSEEGVAAEDRRTKAARLAGHRTWIVDPLDGTREYSEAGRTDWAVHVALCIDGAAVVGAVALPALGVTHSTLDPPKPAARRPAHPRVVVSRTRPPAEAEAVALALGGELVPMGSAGAKAMAVVQGDADIYPHSGGQYEWDSCAPVAVALAAGLWCTRLDGSGLEYNRADPYLPDLLICTHEWGPRVLAALRR